MFTSGFCVDLMCLQLESCNVLTLARPGAFVWCSFTYKFYLNSLWFCGCRWHSHCYGFSRCCCCCQSVHYAAQGSLLAFHVLPIHILSYLALISSFFQSKTYSFISHKTTSTTRRRFRILNAVLCTLLSTQAVSVTVCVCIGFRYRLSFRCIRSYVTWI